MTKTTDAQPPAKPVAAAKDKIVIFDTTLRDGEQCPGATMTFEEKLEVADCLDDDGRRHHRGRLPDRVRRRFRGRHRGRQAREERDGRWPRARRRSADIDRAGEAVRHAKRGRIHTFISTSPSIWSRSCRKSQDEVLEIVTASVTRARNRVEDVEWSAEDATRTEHRLSCAAASRPRSRPAPRPSTCPTPSATPCRKNTPRMFRACASACRMPTRRSSRPTATTTSVWRLPTRWPASTRARGRSNAPSTASASAPATRRSKRS